MLENILTLLIIALSCFVWYFLAMIAKFYRLKSGNGPHHTYYYLSSITLVAGLFFSWDIMPFFLKRYLGPGLIIIGGAALILLSITLYKSMMTVNKSMG
jgi:uncharacterized membrane protein